MSTRAELYNDLKSVLFEEESICERINELALLVSEEFEGKELIILAIMNGSLMMAADLLRRIRIPCGIVCLSVESYYGAVKSSGKIFFNAKEMPNFSGHHILVIDDVFDTGRTLEAVIRKIKSECDPVSVSSGVLLKKKREREIQLVPDYVGFEVDDVFIVGYGLDYQGMYRNLPLIGTLKDECILPEHR